MSRSWRIGDKELVSLKEMLEGGFPDSSEINFITRLEEAFAEKFESPFAIAHNNGTATLHSALAAAGVTCGDEVIVPPLTMASTSLAVLHQNATPVFADIDLETFMIDPESIRRNIASKTRAIIPVAIYGLSPDMDPIMDIAKENNLVVIEDDAQCFLGKYKGRMVGTLGHMASFSFQNSKHISSGEGGIVITSHAEYAEKIRRFTCLGYAALGKNVGSRLDKKTLHSPAAKWHSDLGFNYRIPELCAAVALAQLERLDELVDWRKRCASVYDRVVRPCSWLKPQKYPPITSMPAGAMWPGSTIIVSRDS
jgi:perosamine synthetase